jgi:hypothetical protein
MRFQTVIVFTFILNVFANSQQTATIKGRVSGDTGEPLAGATIVNIVSGKGVNADSEGFYLLTVAAGQQIQIEFSFIGFRKDTIFTELSAGEIAEINVTLHPLPEELGEVVVESWYDRAEALQQINIRSLEHIPLPSGNIESLLTSMGAASRNEMSAQYSVRGGNFDENLIYVNGIEIFRPMLVKAGQQEGLSFINPSLVSSVQFAAGGFDARYGDKMSSVLDIRYKRPGDFGGSVSASLLGASAHFEGSALKRKFTYISGVRYKTNQYLLKSLQTRGDYKPDFLDVQTFLTFNPLKNLEISFLGNISMNTYNVVPESRETAFGTFQQPLNFTVFYEGQEKDRFATLLGALAFDYRHNDRLSLRLTGSAYNTYEKITYDILGQYRIDLLDNTPGSETAGDSILNIGVGGNLIHARNYLDATIYNLSLSGNMRGEANNLSMGISLQKEHFTDRIREWEMIDSAGYSIPYSDEVLNLRNVIFSGNTINAYRFTGHINNIMSIPAGDNEILLNTGIRFNYLTTNKQFLVSPRMSIYFIPGWQRRVTFHVSAGWYHQPPFYKEMRDPEGNIHDDIKAQVSIHFLAGSTIDFLMWERLFRISAEAYYKHLNNLIPYVIDDVEIQYLPQYTASGFASGIEFKINGEFVKDAESWATLSILQTYENRKNDSYGQYPRATNQLVNFGFYFQDYFPSNPSYRVHLNVYFGSRLPYNQTNYDDPEKFYHLQSYRRIDIGMTKSVMTDRNGNRRFVSSRIKDLSFSLEVFNLFGFKNQASYQWVKTVSNQEGIPNIFAVPNYLTGRLLNLRVNLKF